VAHPSVAPRHPAVARPHLDARIRLATIDANAEDTSIEGSRSQCLGEKPVSTRLGLFTLASAVPMGQQVYEGEIVARAPAELGPGWAVEHVAVRSMRSDLPGGTRVPGRLLGDAPPSVRRALGRYLYRGHDLVHRFDLRLPPAPRTEVLTVHDVVPWRFDDEGTAPSDSAASARRAAVVVCPSRFAADEVGSVLGVERVVVIHNGVDPRFFVAEPLSERALTDLGVRRPFVVHAGGSTRRKNLDGLAEAWPLVRAACPETGLVLMGPPDERRDRLFEPLPGTVLVGRVDEGTATGLLAAASVVVVPSRYEGFGLPALEGMAAGVPVVAARRAALPEVCGDAAYLVEPDGPGLAEGVVAALTDERTTATQVAKGRQRAAGFTWEASAAAHAALWRDHAP
jgi:glycosyltransferase involved in cell wall biosynthesis